MKENNEKIAVVPSAEALEHLHWDYRFVARTIATMHEEDFVDESTGEVVSVQIKDNILFERGHELSQDDISLLLFHFQTGDLKEVHLSNQQRYAQVAGKGMTLWVVKASGVKNVKIMLKAKTASIAYEVAKDYIELNYKGTFVIQGIKTFADSIVLEPEESETNISVDRYWYRLIVQQEYEDCGGSEFEYSFVVYAENADVAKMLIDRYLAKRKTEDKDLEPIILKTKTASVISCDVVVPFDFCQAYNDEHKEEE
ncbi:MAG: hypothetical protein IKJ67_01865 [Bacteroidales bacterium]|nr:hypothetical protein [Bacteroidales bacterium]